MKVRTKQTLFDVPLASLDGKKKPVNEGSEIEVDDATGRAMIEAGQATEVAEVKASRRPAKDTASKRAKSRETR